MAVASWCPTLRWAVQFQLHSGAANGPVVYAETHAPTTNAQGLFSVHVGQGTPTSGTFAAIDWGATSVFVEVGLDPAGGTAYSTIGNQQLLSVPYALQAKGAATAQQAIQADSAQYAQQSQIADTALYAQQAGPPGTAAGEVRYWNGTAWVTLAPGTSGQSLIYCAGALRWGYCSVQDRLDSRETPCQIMNSGFPLDSLWGKNYLGGLLAYLDPNTCQGLVAATSDLQAFWQWQEAPSCQSTLIGGTSTALFSGASNTASIAAHFPCGNASLAGYIMNSGPPGFFLPSSDELAIFYTNLHLNGFGNFDIVIPTGLRPNIQQVLLSRGISNIHCQRMMIKVNTQR